MQELQANGSLPPSQHRNPGFWTGSRLARSIAHDLKTGTAVTRVRRDVPKSLFYMPRQANRCAFVGSETCVNGGSKLAIASRAVHEDNGWMPAILSLNHLTEVNK